MPAKPTTCAPTEPCGYVRFSSGYESTPAKPSAGTRRLLRVAEALDVDEARLLVRAAAGRACSGRPRTPSRPRPRPRGCVTSVGSAKTVVVCSPIASGAPLASKIVPRAGRRDDGVLVLALREAAERRGRTTWSQSPGRASRRRRGRRRRAAGGSGGWPASRLSRPLAPGDVDVRVRLRVQELEPEPAIRRRAETEATRRGSSTATAAPRCRPGASPCSAFASRA